MPVYSYSRSAPGPRPPPGWRPPPPAPGGICPKHRPAGPGPRGAKGKEAPQAPLVLPEPPEVTPLPSGEPCPERREPLRQ